MRQDYLLFDQLRTDESLGSLFENIILRLCAAEMTPALSDK